ncbi:MAG: hypothetical protein HY040_25295 [Planctomycetes bacterium]|nr:hypothetical protein [Planctomycetota bacterium]
MKAEHRKELETNVLADRMGRMVKRVRENPRRRTTLYVVAGVIIVVAAYLFMNRISTNKEENSRRWMLLDDGAGPAMELLRRSHGDTNQGKAARFQEAWDILWKGVRFLGQGPVMKVPFRDQQGVPVVKEISPFEFLDVAQERYTSLKTDCAGDPFWEPEAAYHLAVIEEARAIANPDNLKVAKAAYEAVANEHKASAWGKLAGRRAEMLSDARGENTARLYTQMREFFGFREKAQIPFPNILPPPPLVPEPTIKK